MMMKSTKRNKRLAMMVGAALSFGVAYGMTPGDALAADYEITYNGSDWVINGGAFGTADVFNTAALGNLTTALTTDPGVDTVTIIRTDNTNDSALDSVFSSGMDLGAGDVFTVKDGVGDNATTQFSMTAGADSDNVTYTSAGSKFAFTGTPNAATVNVSNAELDLSTVATPVDVVVNADATITSGASSSIGNLTVADGAAVTNAGNATTVNNLNLAGGATVAGGAGAGLTITNQVNVADGASVDFGTGVALNGGLNIGDGATANITEDVTSGEVTGAGTLNIDATKTLNTGNNNITVGNINSASAGTINAGTGKVTITGASADISSLTGVTASEVEAGGTLTADAANITANKITSAGNLTLTNTPTATEVKSTNGSVSLADLGNVTNVTAGNGITFTGSNPSVGSGVTLNAGTGDITADNGLNLSNADANSVTASNIQVTGGAFTPPNDTAALSGVDTVKIDGAATLADTGNAVDLGTTALDVSTASSTDNGGLGSNVKNVTAGSVTLNGNDVDIDGSNLSVTADSIVNDAKVTVSSSSALASKTGGSTNPDITAKGFEVTDSNAANVGDLTITTGGELNTATSATNGGVKAGSVTLANGATVAAGSKVTTDALNLDADDVNLNSEIAKLALEPATPGGEVTVTVANYGKLTEGQKTALQDALNNIVTNGTVKVAGAAPTPPASGNSTAVMNDIKAAVGDEVAALVTANAAVVANVDPFVSKLPSADALAKLEALSNVNGKDLVKEYYDALKSEGGDVSGLSPDAKTQAARLTAAVQQAGKTAAAPGVTAARAATAITAVLTDNVVNRNAEIRDFAAAAAVDDGRPAPDRVWFQYKHTNMDVDGDVYEESNVNTNTFQLGYDAKLGENDYLGVFVGTTTGDAEFKGPKRSGRMDIDGSFDVGIYGTHMLPQDQYIDYMIHTGNFDSEYAGSKWGTTDTGAMVGYGVKIASSDSLTLNPYVQLAYDKIDVDSYWAGPNYITNDDSDNWTAKLGMNVIDASGLYGGLAYSRGLSGSYNAYINGVPMPSSDFNANVLYLSLGYRANMSKNAVLDLSMEKTFMDYDGWTASGKVNFYF